MVALLWNVTLARAWLSTLGAAALERQFAHDLRPALALFAQQRIGGQKGIVEYHLVEMMLTAQVDDRGDLNVVGGLEIDQELTHPAVAVVALGTCVAPPPAADGTNGIKKVSQVRITR